MRIILIIAACAMPIAVSVSAAGSHSATGRWSGTTKARCGAFTTDHSRCNAVQNITLELKQEGEKVSGSYTCAYGNINCRGMQEKGAISEGSIKGDQLAFVTMTPDKSRCRFSGVIEGNSGKGSYACKGGSQLDERGSWRIERAE